MTAFVSGISVTCFAASYAVAWALEASRLFFRSGVRGVVMIGFAVAGLLATGYQLVTEQPLSFRLLNQGLRLVTFLSIPVLTFAAPFVIMRNVIRGRRIERRRFEFVMLATVLAGFWSLMSGTVVVTAFKAFSQLFA